MSRQAVAAPPSSARSINLRTSARLVDDGLNWLGGIAFVPEACGGGFSLDPCHGPADVEEGKDAGEQKAKVEWDPYEIYIADRCAYAQNPGVFEDLKARARRSLEAQTSHLVEEILWSGTVDGADFTATHPNIALVNATVTGTPAPPVTALAQMDELLIDELGGRRGMIHVPAFLMHQKAFYGLLRQNGNTWETVSGNLVVPGTGYPGTDTDGADDPTATWIYGTSPVELRLGEISVLPTSLDEAIDRGTNELVVRAERAALAYWDLCALVGVPVCDTDPGPACETES